MIDPTSLLTELGAEYPDLSGRAIGEAVEHACRSAHTLVSEGEDIAARIAVLTRDRLDLMRERASLAQRRALNR